MYVYMELTVLAMKHHSPKSLQVYESKGIFTSVDEYERK